jgi:hypothetical protein
MISRNFCGNWIGFVIAAVIMCAAAVGLGLAPGTCGTSLVVTAAGGVVALNGIDNVQAGLRQVISGKPVQTATSSAVESVTGSHLAGEGVNLAIGLVGPGAVAKMATGSGLIKSIKSVAGDTWGSIKGAGTSIKNWWKGTPKVSPNGCFLAATLVSRYNSQQSNKTELIPIEQIKEYDQVWSCDSLNGRWQPKTVLEVLTHLYTGDIITIETEYGVIETTGGHPIWVKSGNDLEHRPRCEHIYEDEHEIQPHGRWVNARDLQIGDKLFSRSKISLQVLNIFVRSEIITVHNLTVADYHTYAVGFSEALVHNKSDFVIIQTGGKTVEKQTAEKIMEYYNLHFPKSTIINMLKFEGFIKWF